MQLEKYQIVGAILVIVVVALISWSKGYNDGKKVGYYKGRNLAWSIKNNKVSQ